ncbi:MAG: general secretion pathway protein GspK [Leptospiraceae bacterium]|nr:general secretion pathway protein GspK [Leptospiraceae bacterium]
MILFLVAIIGGSSFVIANQYAGDRMIDFKIAKANADGFKAFLLARAGLQGGIGALKKCRKKYYTSQELHLIHHLSQWQAGIIYYRISSEDGKFNINELIRNHDKLPNLKVQEMVTRLFEQLGINRDKVFPIIDWIDDNSEEIGGGAEVYYYSNLKPPRKIKNAPMYSLSELTAIKGWDRKLVYESLKNPDKDKNVSKDFLSEEEKLLVTDSDYVLSNNITAYLPFRDTGDDRININAAPYHVLMSISEFMTRQAVMRILKYKLEKGGYIKEINDLKNFAEFQIKTTSMGAPPTNSPSSGPANPSQPPPPSSSSSGQAQALTLFDEIAGTGSAVSTGRVKTKGEVYKVVGVGTVVRQLEELAVYLI